MMNFNKKKIKKKTSKPWTAFVRNFISYEK